MKQGRTFADLTAELERQAGAKRDFVTRASAMRIHSNGHSNLYLNERFDLSETGHRNMAQYLDIPKPYYERLRASTEELICSETDQNLFDLTVNALLSAKGDDRRLVRTLDGTARAILSDGYSVDFDNLDIFRACVSAMERAGLGPDDVVSCEVTDRMLYLKVVSPKLEVELKPENIGQGGRLLEPQVVRAGFVVRNSEIGAASLTIQPLLFKLVCKNGWIVEEGMKRRHIGRALEETEGGEVYRSDTRIAEAAVQLLKIRDRITSAIDESRFAQLVGRIEATAGIQIEGPADLRMEAIAVKFGLTPAEKERVTHEFLKSEGRTVWELTDAITSVAQTVDNYERATELESLGGKIATLPESELRGIAYAA